MNALQESREDLIRALLELKNAAGPVVDVVAAIEALAREVSQEEIDANKPYQR